MSKIENSRVYDFPNWKRINFCLNRKVFMNFLKMKRNWLFTGSYQLRRDYLRLRLKWTEEIGLCCPPWNWQTGRIPENGAPYGNTPIPLAQQVTQRLDQQFEGLEEYDYRLEPRTGWRFYPSSRTTHSSPSSHWQQSSDWKWNRSWDSWQTSSWQSTAGADRHLPRTTFSHAQLLHRRVFTCC